MSLDYSSNQIDSPVNANKPSIATQNAQYLLVNQSQGLVYKSLVLTN